MLYFMINNVCNFTVRPIEQWWTVHSDHGLAFCQVQAMILYQSNTFLGENKTTWCVINPCAHANQLKHLKLLSALPHHPTRFDFQLSPTIVIESWQVS